MMIDNNSNDWQKVIFQAPITAQSIHNIGSMPDGKKELRVKGPAIHATTTRNGTTFTAEELRRAATSLEGKPVLKDHENLVDSIVGRVTSAYFNDEVNAVIFEGTIKDQRMIEKIEEGLITSVSIGAMVGSFDELMDEDGNVVETRVKDIDFVEISLVAVPADPNAGVARAFQKAYIMCKAQQLHSSESKEDNDMTKETVDKKEETSVALAEEIKNLTHTVSEALGKFEETTAKLTERVSALEALFEEEAEAEIKESRSTDSPVKEEVTMSADETIGEVVSTSVENKEEKIALEIKPGNRGWNLSGDYAAFAAVRLTR